MLESLRRPLRIALIVAALLTASVWLRNALGLELDTESIRSFAADLGPAAPILFVGLVAGRSLLALPSQLVLIAAGLCFGTAVGTIVGGVGLTVSGFALFSMARYAGRQGVEDRLGPRFGRLLDLAGHRAGALALALGSGYPISPLSPIHAAAGLTPMTVSVFLTAALAGGLMRAAVFAFFGDAISASSSRGLVYASIALCAVLLTPLLFPKGRAWLSEWARPVDHTSPEGVAGPAGVEAVPVAIEAPLRRN